jgi:dihydrofolate reductase
MKTQYYVASSLDGFIADPQNSLDWLLQFGEGTGSDYQAFIHEVGAIAMGATTYRWILDHHIQSNSQQPKPWPYEQPVWVFTSRTLPTIHGTDIRFARGDVRPVHRQMITAAGDKNIWLVGGGALVGQFYDHGLLDEMIVTIVPVTLGSGAPLLPRPITTPPLRLISVTARDGDPLVTLRYEVPRPWTKE